MFEGSIKALQAALTVALDQAERFHADVAKSNLRAQQTVGRQLEEHTIPSLKRLLEAEDAFGGIPALKRTAGFLEQPGGLNGVVGQAISKNVKEEVGALVEDAENLAWDLLPQRHCSALLMNMGDDLFEAGLDAWMAARGVKVTGWKS